MAIKAHCHVERASKVTLQHGFSCDVQRIPTKNDPTKIWEGEPFLSDGECFETHSASTSHRSKIHPKSPSPRPQTLPIRPQKVAGISQRSHPVAGRSDEAEYSISDEISPVASDAANAREKAEN